MKIFRNILPLLFIAIAANVSAQHSLKKTMVDGYDAGNS